MHETSSVLPEVRNMIYISEDEQGWQLDSYFEYLASVRAQMPPAAYSFASDRRNYDLSSHQSLHDAWLEYLAIREPSSGERHELRRIEIECVLLGPYHDKEIVLTYLDVASYALKTPKEFAAPPSADTGHGDLLMHEMRSDSTGLIVHEMVFSRGSEIVITARDFRHQLRQVRSLH